MSVLGDRDQRAVNARTLSSAYIEVRRDDAADGDVEDQGKILEEQDDSAKNHQFFPSLYINFFFGQKYNKL